jgi:hypothetical protein
MTRFDLFRGTLYDGLYRRLIREGRSRDQALAYINEKIAAGAKRFELPQMLPPPAASLGPARDLAARAAAVLGNGAPPAVEAKPAPVARAGAGAGRKRDEEVWRCMKPALDGLQKQRGHKNVKGACRLALHEHGPQRYRKQPVTEIEPPDGFVRAVARTARDEGLLS